MPLTVALHCSMVKKPQFVPPPPVWEGRDRLAEKSGRPMQYEPILYETDGPIATITLNRPDELNTIVPPMPDEVEAAVHAATRDKAVKVIVLRGAGRAFCAGYN